MTPGRRLVTAILPVYNRAASVARAIDSVLAQTWPALELIVVDDGSTDGTAEVLRRYEGRATILRQANGGAYAARNLALRHARGDLVAFIDSDDAWLPDRLERQVPLIRGETALAYGDIVIVSSPEPGSQRERRTRFQSVRPARGRVLRRFIWGNFVPTSTVLVRRAALDEIGGFPEESRISADYLAWVRIARHHAFDYVDAPVALYTRHADGISADLGRSLAARIDLFGAERERTREPGTRRMLDHLLFNLALHLLLATARGKAREVARPLHLARGAASGTAPATAATRCIAFLLRHSALRARKILS